MFLRIFIFLMLTFFVTKAQTISSSTIIENKELVQSINDYYLDNESSNDFGILLIQVSKTKDTTKYLLKEIINRSSYYYNVPIVYTLLDGKPIFFYFGIESDIRVDTIYFAQVDSIGKKFTVNDLWRKKDVSAGLTYITPMATNHAKQWLLVFFENKLIYINKDARELFPIKTKE